MFRLHNRGPGQKHHLSAALCRIRLSRQQGSRSLARADQAAQSRLTFITGTRDDLFLKVYKNDIPVDAPVNRAWGESFGATRETLSYDDLPDFSHFETFSEAVEFIVSCLLQDGVNDVLALDLTDQEIGVPVVHVAPPFAGYQRQLRHVGARIEIMQVSKRTASKLKRCIFVGPSLNETRLDGTIKRFGPAQLGSIYLAAKSGYKIIGLVDGIFGNVPSVWHKEILYALDQGCVVCGSSSTGAFEGGRTFRLRDARDRSLLPSL